MTTTQTGTTTAAARPQLRRTTLWQQSLAVVRRNGAHYRQQPELLLDVTIQPIMFVLLFAFVFGASIQVLSPGGYREWLLGGIMGQTVTFAAFIVAIGLTADIEKGIVDRLRSLPIHRSALLVGRSISSLLHSSVGIVIMSLTGLLIGWRIRDGIPRAVLAYALLLLWGFAMIWFGIWIGSLMKTVEAVNGVMFTILFPITFVANTFAPTAPMPTWLQKVAEWNPLSALVQAIRELWGNTPESFSGVRPLEHPVLATVLWSLFFIAVFAPLSLRTFQRRTQS